MVTKPETRLSTLVFSTVRRALVTSRIPQDQSIRGYDREMTQKPLPKILQSTTSNPSLSAFGADAAAVRDWIKGLPPELLTLMNEASRPRKYVAGEFLFRNGELVEGLYMIDTGRVQISTTTEDGREFVIAIFNEGACLGLISGLDGFPSPWSCQAHCDTSVHLLPRKALLDILDREPRYYQHFTQLVLLCLRGLTGLLVDQAVLDVRARLAKRLLQMANVYNDTQSDRTIPIRVSQEELALSLGATRQSVQSHLGDFRKRGWIAVERGCFMLLDPAALQACITGK